MRKTLSAVMKRNRVFICLIIGLASPVMAVPPGYEDGAATQKKIQYCTRLVNIHGHKSQSINQDYYGVGVKRPVRGQWDVRLKTPGWFSDDLYIVFEQTTSGRYEDFTHTAYCLWSEDAPWFEFKINHHTYGALPICYWGAGDPEYSCP